MKTKKKIQPLDAVVNGHDEQGRFTRGNSCARGNPFAKKVARLRSALLQAITPADVRAIIKKVIKRARGGDLAAAKEVFDRAVGRPVELDFLEKIENLERILDEIAGPDKSN